MRVALSFVSWVPRRSIAPPRPGRAELSAKVESVSFRIVAFSGAGTTIESAPPAALPSGAVVLKQRLRDRHVVRRVDRAAVHFANVLGKSVAVWLSLKRDRVHGKPFGEALHTLGHERAVGEDRAARWVVLRPPVVMLSANPNGPERLRLLHPSHATAPPRRPASLPSMGRSRRASAPSCGGQRARRRPSEASPFSIAGDIDSAQGHFALVTSSAR